MPQHSLRADSHHQMFLSFLPPYRSQFLCAGWKSKQDKCSGVPHTEEQVKCKWVAWPWEHPRSQADHTPQGRPHHAYILQLQDYRAQILQVASVLPPDMEHLACPLLMLLINPRGCCLLKSAGSISQTSSPC